jgi:hypothetical protein
MKFIHQFIEVEQVDNSMCLLLFVIKYEKLAPYNNNHDGSANAIKLR